MIDMRLKYSNKDQHERYDGAKYLNRSFYSCVMITHQIRWINKDHKEADNMIKKNRFGPDDTRNRGVCRFLRTAARIQSRVPVL
jgi:hypothetical protein